MTSSQLHYVAALEHHDEWDGPDRCYFSEHSMKLLTSTDEEVAVPELNAASSQKLIPHGVKTLHHAAGRNHLLAMSGQFPWVPAPILLAVYAQFRMAIDSSSPEYVNRCPKACSIDVAT